MFKVDFLSSSPAYIFPIKLLTNQLADFFGGAQGMGPPVAHFFYFHAVFFWKNFGRID